jgi:hypothetical protein
MLAMALVSGCQSAQAPSGEAAAKPNFGPPIGDVRTAATIQEMENWYVAEKNSQPTHHGEALEKKRQEEAAKKAQEAAAKTQDPSGKN